MAFKNRAAATLATALVVSLALAGCTAPGGVDEVRLGVLAPLTGSLQAFGPGGLRAVQLAAEQVNAAGGLLGGATVRVVSADTQTDKSKAPTEMNRLVNVERVHAVIGAYSSGVTLSVWRTAVESGVPLVTPASTAPTLTGLDDDGLVFRVPPSDAFQGKVMARLLLEDEVRTVGVLAVNNDYGVGFAAVMKQAFEAGGGEVVAQETFAEAGTVYNTEVDAVAAEDPDAIVLIAYPTEGAVIMRNAYERGHTESIAWYFSEGLYDSAFITGSGEDENNRPLGAGFKGTTPQGFTPAGLPTAAAFNALYENRFGEPPSLFGAEAYDAAVLLMLAIQRAGTTDGDAVAAELRGLSGPPGEKVSDVVEALELVRMGRDIDYGGASGEIDWDAAGDPAIGAYAVWRITEAGERETLQDNLVVS